MSSDTLVKCGYSPCRCLVEAEQKFCGSECSSARGTTSDPCLCGHPGCVDDETLLDEDEPELLSPE
jgi:hypothetical protein